LSPSKTGVDPSQQILSSLGHLPPGLPPGLPPVGVLPSAQVLGLPPSGQGGVLLSPSKTGADPSEQVGAEPSAHFGFPFPFPLPLRAETEEMANTSKTPIRMVFIIIVVLSQTDLELVPTSAFI